MLTLEDEDTMLLQMVQIIFLVILGYTAENTASYSMDYSATQLQKSQNSQQNTDVEETQNYHNVQYNTQLLPGHFNRKTGPYKRN
jgi:cell division protein FtsB